MLEITRNAIARDRIRAAELEVELERTGIVAEFEAAIAAGRPVPLATAIARAWRKDLGL